MAVYTIDEQDYSKVNYTGTWITGGSTDVRNKTVMSSTVVGDYFTVSFKGSSIAAFGSFDTTSGGVVSTYSVDGAPAAVVTSPAGLSDTWGQQFWRSGDLQPGDHKLVVNMSKVNAESTNEGTIWFDYFKVYDQSFTAVKPSTSSTESGPSEGCHKSAPIGAIVGGVIGGLLFILALALLLFLLYRRRARIQPVTTEKAEIFPGNQQSTAQPFAPFPGTEVPQYNYGSAASTNTSTNASAADLLPATYRMSGTPLSPWQSLGRPSPLGTGHMPQPSVSSRTELSYAPQTDNSYQTSLSGSMQKLRNDDLRVMNLTAPDPAETSFASASTSQSEKGPVEPVLPAMQHVDSGIRGPELAVAGPSGMEKVELPPVYSSV